MGLKDFWQTGQVAISAYRLADRVFYEQVAEEMQRGVRDEALWLMAYERAKGQEQEAKANYIGLRVQALKDEKTIVDAMQRGASTASTPTKPSPSPPEKPSPSPPDVKQSDGEFYFWLVAAPIFILAIIVVIVVIFILAFS